MIDDGRLAGKLTRAEYLQVVWEFSRKAIAIRGENLRLSQAATRAPGYAPRVALGIQCHPPGLAAWSTPEWVVVSGDEDRRGVVRAAYEAVGARLLETTDVGAVTVDIARDGALRVSTFRTRPE